MGAPQGRMLERFREIVGARGFIDDPAAMEPHLVEWRDLYRGRAAAVLKPASVEEVSAILLLCQESGTRIVPQGGNTGLVGGGIPFSGGEEVVLSLSRLNRVRAIDSANDTITVEAGCILANVQAAAEQADRLFPLRIGSEGTCQIGGNLSTNAGGTAVLHYGNMRDLVLGLEVVLPDGRIWDGLRGLRKDNTGYDLKQLFIGAEGTLGVITAAVLKLFPKPRDVQVAMVSVRDVEAAIELLAMAKGTSGNQVTAFELMPRLGIDYVLRHIPGTQEPLPSRHDWNVLMELSGGKAAGDLAPMMQAILEAGMEAGLVLDGAIAQNAAQAAALWRLRDGMSEAQKPEGGSIKHDISVPVSRMPEFIARASEAVRAIVPGTRIVAFGHIGDGNVHFNPSQPVGADKQWFLDQWQPISRAVHDICAELGGSISAEHGLGRMKREEITRYKSAVEMDLMRQIKGLLDPKGIMNPGKVV
ncbi:MAG: FAD-binding oxidoreductase [Alphaproteobacteria bacterium]|nr:FAD-binding oxidoreductase [Alphaproteobacteria bacterium]